MNRLPALILLAAALVACDDEPTGTGGQAEFTVMTRNIYVGADIDVLMTAPTPNDIPVLAAQAWGSVVATNFAERAEALADEIEAANPHLIGLQEVSLFRAQSPGDYLIGNPQPATAVVLDHIDTLLDALSARGLAYSAVAVCEGMDVEIPMAISPTEFDDMRLTDHEVILVRSDVQVANVQAANFTVNMEIPLGGAGGPVITILRGWASVDATIDGATVRFVSTHLEPPEYAPQVQLAQAAELRVIHSGAAVPVIVVGDFNSNADGSTTTTYDDFLAAGYSDTWTAGGSGAGLTCCHDDDLQNAAADLVKRIDYILFRGDLEVVGADVIGDDPAERTPSGLWPSDHAGVVATLRFQ
jgi:endonuclease/exonuclease/phosphatase family metal-dependent hydrolase